MKLYVVVAHHEGPSKPSGRGYVVRRRPLAWPYHLVPIVRSYKQAAAAQRLVDDLNAGRKKVLDNGRVVVVR